MLGLRIRASYRARLFNGGLPKIPKILLQNGNSGVRRYATSGKKAEEAPGFKKIFLVALVGTLVFMQAANSLDKNKPKTSYSEEEFENVMNGLKRRVALFPAGTLNVKFVPSSSILSKVQSTSAKVIDPQKVVAYFKGQKDGTYEALLSDLESKHGDDYINKLPNGMLVMLIGKYMKLKCSANDEVLIVNFPHNIKDAIKFENEVSTVSKVLIPKKNSDSDLCQYYNTVHKVEEI